MNGKYVPHEPCPHPMSVGELTVWFKAHNLYAGGGHYGMAGAMYKWVMDAHLGDGRADSYFNYM